METITIKMEEKMLKEIDQKLENNRYSTRTEFIRDAIRQRLSEMEKEEMIRAVYKLRGSSGKKTTDEDIERAREIVSKEFMEKFNIK